MDAAEFDELYAATAQRLVGQLTAMTGDSGEAQDCVQEAFIRAWRNRTTLDTAGNPEAWLRTTAWRISVSRWRRATAGVRALHRHGPAPDLDAPGTDHADLVRALRQLSAEQRRAIVLHHLCDLSIEDIATETGAPVGTIKARLSRGRAALAALLTDQLEPSPSEEGRHV